MLTRALDLLLVLPLADNWLLMLDDGWIDLCWQMAALVKGWDRDAGYADGWQDDWAVVQVDKLQSMIR